MKSVIRVASVVAVCCFVVPSMVSAAGTSPPDVRHPQLAHVCDSGPMRGCPCTPTSTDLDGICSPIDRIGPPFFEDGPQCVPFVLPEPRATGVLTIMVDDDVTDYERPDAPSNRAFTLLVDVKAPDGHHLLSDTYQNLQDPTDFPAGGWDHAAPGDPPDFEEIDELGPIAWFDPELDLLGELKPFLFLAPEMRLAEALRALLGAPEGTLPVIISDVTMKKGELEDRLFDSLATVLQIKVKVGFAATTLGGTPPCNPAPM